MQTVYWRGFGQPNAGSGNGGKAGNGGGKGGNGQGKGNGNNGNGNGNNSPGILPSSYQTNLFGGYSLNKLYTSATAAVRVRRSSDNAEQDIGFTETYLDTTSLLSFCGAGDGFVTKWYDQSGNARHLLQATAGLQPQIVHSGKFFGSINFDGVDDYLSPAQTLTAGQTKLSTYLAGRIRAWRQSNPALQQGAAFFTTYDGSTIQSSLNQGYDSNVSTNANYTNANAFVRGNTGSSHGEYFAARGLGVNAVHASIADLTQGTSSGQLKKYIDGVVQTPYFQEAASTGSFTAQSIYLGGVPAPLSNWVRFAAQTFLMYQGSAHAAVDVAAISTLVAPSYGTPTTLNTIDSFTTGLSGLFGLRKLRSAYAGSCLRVRRSSDNTEQDIGFTTAGHIDSSALTTFCGAGNGFVTTWYDQSAAANHFIQATAANQPQIVSSGSYLGYLQFDGSNDIMEQTSASGTPTAFTGYVGATLMTMPTLYVDFLNHSSGASRDCTLGWTGTTSTKAIAAAVDDPQVNKSVSFAYTTFNGQVIAANFVKGAASMAAASQMYQGGAAITRDFNSDAGSIPAGSFAAYKWNIGGRPGPVQCIAGRYTVVAIYEANHAAATVDAVSAILG